MNWHSCDHLVRKSIHKIAKINGRPCKDHTRRLNSTWCVVRYKSCSSQLISSPLLYNWFLLIIKVCKDKMFEIIDDRDNDQKLSTIIIVLISFGICLGIVIISVAFVVLMSRIIRNLKRTKPAKKGADICSTWSEIQFS